MSNFSEAVRQMQEAEAKCPKCGVVNTPGKTPTIRIDVHNQAWCSNCGEEWFIQK